MKWIPLIIAALVIGGLLVVTGQIPFTVTEIDGCKAVRPVLGQIWCTTREKAAIYPQLYPDGTLSIPCGKECHKMEVSTQIPAGNRCYIEKKNMIDDRVIASWQLGYFPHLGIDWSDTAVMNEYYDIKCFRVFGEGGCWDWNGCPSQFAFRVIRTEKFLAKSVDSADRIYIAGTIGCDLQTIAEKEKKKFPEGTRFIDLPVGSAIPFVYKYESIPTYGNVFEFQGKKWMCLPSGNYFCRYPIEIFQSADSNYCAAYPDLDKQDECFQTFEQCKPCLSNYECPYQGAIHWEELIGEGYRKVQYTCESGKCVRHDLGVTECNPETNRGCDVNEFCDIDGKCKKVQPQPTECPYECCVNMENYIDKLCEGNMICCPIDSKVPNTCRSTIEDCYDGKPPEQPLQSIFPVLIAGLAGIFTIIKLKKEKTLGIIAGLLVAGVVWFVVDWLIRNWLLIALGGILTGGILIYLVGFTAFGAFILMALTVGRK